MRNFVKIVLALGLVAGAVSLGTPNSAKAQGFYIDAPGVHVWAGERHHHHHYWQRYRDDDDYGYNYGPRYRRGYGAYAADPSHPYGYNYNYGDPRCGIPNYTIQDGICKPYTGR